VHYELCINQKPFPNYNKIEEASEPPPSGIALQR